MSDPYVAPPYVAPTYEPPNDRPLVDLPVGVFDDPKSGWSCTEVEPGRFIVSHDKSNEVFQAGSVADAETTVRDVFTP